MGPQRVRKKFLPGERDFGRVITDTKYEGILTSSNSCEAVHKYVREDAHYVRCRTSHHFTVLPKIAVFNARATQNRPHLAITLTSGVLKNKALKNEVLAYAAKFESVSYRLSLGGFNSLAAC